MLFWWETIAPGRQAAGERFAFERLRISTRVDLNGQPAVREELLLEPARRSLESVSRMGKHEYLATFYAIAEGVAAQRWRELEDLLNDRCGNHRGDDAWGASTLAAGGVVVRGLASSSREIPSRLLESWRIARRFLTGDDPVRPRKVY